MRILKQDTSQVHLEFDSLYDFASLDSKMQPEQTTYDSSKTEKDSFCGCSFQQAVNFATMGWADGRDKLINLTQSGIEYLKQDTIPTEFRDVAGFRPDVPAYCAGDPANMVQKDETVKPAVLRIFVDMGIHCDVKPKQVLNYGSALLAWVELIESEGIRCEIWSIMGTTGNSKDYSARILIKESDQVFDYGALAFALSHPAMNRRLNWRVKEQFAELWSGHGKTKSGWGIGYGYPSDVTLYDFEEDYILMESIRDTHKQCNTVQSALEVFEGQLKPMLEKYHQD